MVSKRDLVRFGQLYLQGGVWQEKQIVPEGWVRESTRVHVPAALRMIREALDRGTLRSARPVRIAGRTFQAKVISI